MDKIVIVGLADDNRQTIIKSLKVNCNIIAYTDINTKYCGFEHFDYVPYIKLCDLKNIAYDYIIICYPALKDILNAEKQLMDIGVKSSSIIEFEYYKNTLCINPILVFEKLDVQWDALLFGMSHSQCALQPQYLQINLYKFSSPSMDMFCQFELVKYLSKKHREKLMKVKYFTFEMPYYIFNYDLSSFRSFVINRLYYFHIFNNYHHFGDCSNDRILIERFENYLNLFEIDQKSDKFSMSKEVKNEEKTIFRLLKRYLSLLKQNLKIINLKDNVWYKEYQKTQQENVQYWQSIVKIIKDINPAAHIQIVIFPFNPLFRYLNKKAIDSQRNIFYKSIDGDKNGIEIYDYFNLNKKYYYADHCHLMTESGIKFTNYIKTQLFK